MEAAAAEPKVLVDGVIELFAGDLVVEDARDYSVCLEFGDGMGAGGIRGLEVFFEGAAEDVEIGNKVCDDEEVNGKSEGEFGKNSHGRLADFDVATGAEELGDANDIPVGEADATGGA